MEKPNDGLNLGLVVNVDENEIKLDGIARQGRGVQRRKRLPVGRSNDAENYRERKGAKNGHNFRGSARARPGSDKPTRSAVNKIWGKSSYRRCAWSKTHRKIFSAAGRRRGSG
ncbi:hypothetical protein Salat_0236400 [Sesamum alatum]|uniref:Uncharacterized protein n=1 Tax=Sesamum alatum TaxID=300844 RepID=A0AAE1YZB9_9LAMI|nr:hypothetical protein Salat_0236400 [Sesamum alatum]